MAETKNPSCVLYGPRDVRYEDRPVPSLNDPHEVLIRISYIGVCGSDVHFYNHAGVTRRVTPSAPLTMGHEASGIIHSIGSAVTLIKPGDRVAIEPGFPCRRCKTCKSGRYNLCKAMKFAADPPDTHGTLAKYYKVPEDCVYKLPERLSLQEGVLAEPLSVAVHGVRLADMGRKPGGKVLVMGCGTVGLLAAATAKAFGAGAVWAAEVNQRKREFAKEFLEGVGVFEPDMSSTAEEEAERFRREARLDGVDVVVECTGAESAIQTGIHALAAGGVFVQIGSGKKMQPLPLLAMCEKEIVVKTSFRYGPGDFDLALELMGSGRIGVESLISSEVPFEKAVEAWEKTAKGEGMKNLICGV